MKIKSASKWRFFGTKSQKRAKRTILTIKAISGIAISLAALWTILTPSPLARFGGEGYLINACDLELDSTQKTLAYLIQRNREVVYADALMVNFIEYLPTVPEGIKSSVACKEGNGVSADYGDRIEYALDKELAGPIATNLRGKGLDPRGIKKVIFLFDWQRELAQDRFLNVWFGNARVAIRGAILPVFRVDEDVLRVEISGVDVVATELVKAYECAAILTTKPGWQGYLECVIP